MLVGGRTALSVAVLLLAGCGRAPQVVDADTGIKICRATIAMLMQRPVDIVRYAGADGEVIRVSYRRPDDGTTWVNKCKFEGNRVIWGAQPGRWRDISDVDEYITFELGGSRSLRLTQLIGGSSMSEDFALDAIDRELAASAHLRRRLVRGRVACLANRLD